MGYASFRQTRRITDFSKPIPETCRAERLALGSHQESQVIACRHRVDCLLERRHHRHVERDSSLLALEGECSAANVQPSHPDDVAARLADLHSKRIDRKHVERHAMVDETAKRLAPVRGRRRRFFVQAGEEEAREKVKSA